MAMQDVNCSYCGAPSRAAICVNGGRQFEKVEGDWFISLVKCPSCMALWQSIAYEPFAAFEYLVPWPHTPGLWKKAYEMDEGVLLEEWQEAVLVEAWERLTDIDKAMAEQHYQRAAQASPYFRIFASDAEWQGRAYYLRKYHWSKRFSAEEVRLLEVRRMPLPDIENFVKTGKLTALT